MSQPKIDRFFGRKHQADRNDNVNKQIAQIDLTSDSEDQTSQTKKPRVKPNPNVPCLSTLDELKKRLEGDGYNGNLSSHKKKWNRKVGRVKKPVEDEWFYMYCDEHECEPDCDDHYKIDLVMMNESEEARKRVRFYREQLKNESKDCPVEYIFGYER